LKIKWSRRMPGGAGHHAQILGTVMPAGYFGRMSAMGAAGGMVHGTTA
jgi:hypothetical protein